MMAVVAVPVPLNSIGVYGFLTRAHVEHALAGMYGSGSQAGGLQLQSCCCSRPQRGAPFNHSADQVNV